MPAPDLTSRALPTAAKHRIAASSIASVYASASSYTHFCVIPNANAYRFSRSQNAVCSDGGR
jgi:hypothetical protein